MDFRAVNIAMYNDKKGMDDIMMRDAECMQTGTVMAHGQQAAEAQSMREKVLTAYNSGSRDFHDWHLAGADLSGCMLSDTDFSGANLSGANLFGANMNHANLSKADLSGANLSRIQLEGSDLCWAKFSNAELVGADLSKSQARAANFSNALMIRAKLNDMDCLGACFANVNATAAQMESVNFECADLSGIALMSASLYGSNCSWCNLTDARLNWANLSWCLLEAAELENVNLTGTLLRAVNLSFANLTGAILTGADLYFANLSGACMPRESINARLSSARLTSQTYQRSGWKREMLREYQQKGAIILDFSSLSKDVQNYIREGACNLRIAFSIPIDSEAQLALEMLIYYVTHAEENLRILSISNDEHGGSVAFYSPNSENIDLYVSALRDKCWIKDRETLQEIIRASREKKPDRVPDADIMHTLDKLCDHIKQIQALVPVSSDDQIKKIHDRIESMKQFSDKTRISWSSVSLPCVDHPSK